MHPLSKGFMPCHTFGGASGSRHPPGRTRLLPWRATREATPAR